MLRLDLFQTLLRGRNMFSEFLLLVGLEPFAFEFLRVSLDLTFKSTNFLVHRADSCDQSLASRFFQMQTADLLRDFQSGAREFTPISQKLLRTLAARSLRLVSEFFVFLQTSLVELSNVLKSFDSPL